MKKYYIISTNLTNGNLLVYTVLHNDTKNAKVFGLQGSIGQEKDLIESTVNVLKAFDYFGWSVFSEEDGEIDVIKITTEKNYDQEKYRIQYEIKIPLMGKYLNRKLDNELMVEMYNDLAK